MSTLESVVASEPRAADSAPNGTPSEDRDEQGRLTKGNRGRPKGSRNKRSVLVEQMMHCDLEQIVATCLRLAKGGDMAAIREVLVRVAPVRKGAPVAVEMPLIRSVTDVPAALAKLAEHVADGSLSPEEAAAIAALLERYVDAFEAIDLVKRVEALEVQYEAALQDRSGSRIKR
jgi:hypothetical protein